MADISKININNTEFIIKDKSARNQLSDLAESVTTKKLNAEFGNMTKEFLVRGQSQTIKLLNLPTQMAPFEKVVFDDPNVVLVKTAQDLIDISNEIRDSDSTYTKQIILLNDIDMAGLKFNGLGYSYVYWSYNSNKWNCVTTLWGAKSKGFRGSFDGRGHTIRNVNIVHDPLDTEAFPLDPNNTTKSSHNSSVYCTGFFNLIDGGNANAKNVTIKNVIFENITVTNVDRSAEGFTGSDTIGCVFGRASGGMNSKKITIENVHVRNGVVNSVHGGEVAGFGATADYNYLSIKNCSFYGEIHSKLETIYPADRERYSFGGFLAFTQTVDDGGPVAVQLENCSYVCNIFFDDEDEDSIEVYPGLGGMVSRLSIGVPCYKKLDSDNKPIYSFVKNCYSDCKIIKNGVDISDTYKDFGFGPVVGRFDYWLSYCKINTTNASYSNYILNSERTAVDHIVPGTTFDLHVSDNRIQFEGVLHPAERTFTINDIDPVYIGTAAKVTVTYVSSYNSNKKSYSTATDSNTFNFTCTGPGQTVDIISDKQFIYTISIRFYPRYHLSENEKLLLLNNWTGNGWNRETFPESTWKIAHKGYDESGESNSETMFPDYPEFSVDGVNY